MADEHSALTRKVFLDEMGAVNAHLAGAPGPPP